MCVSGRTCPDECQLHIGITLNAGKGRIPFWYLYIFFSHETATLQRLKAPKNHDQTEERASIAESYLISCFSFQFQVCPTGCSLLRIFQVENPSCSLQLSTTQRLYLLIRKVLVGYPYSLTLNKTERYWAATIPSVNDLTSEPWEGGGK